jgi:hypothetical protein
MNPATRSAPDAEPGVAGPVAALSLLHPRGAVARFTFLGGAAGGEWTAAHEAASGGPDDLILLTPARDEARDDSWVARAVQAARNVEGDGLVVVAGSRRLRSALSAAGLRPEVRLLHVPSLPESRFVFPFPGAAASFALRELVPMDAVKRRLTPAIGLPGASLLLPTSVVFRPPGAKPLLDWLSRYGEPAGGASAIVARSWRFPGRTVLHRFSQGRTPDLVVKVGAESAREGEALREIAARARTARVDVPAVVQEDVVGGVPALAEAPVPGAPAPEALRGAPQRAHQLLGQISEWLAEWNGATEVRRAFGSRDAERLVLDPARRAAAELRQGDAFVRRLQALCEACDGAELPFVDTHNDLTAANVLLGPDGRLGVIDWESAEADRLPLGDLAYAAADFAAAVAGYRDRPAAFGEAFEPSGSFFGVTSELIDRAVASHSMPPEARELAIASCWLLHAENERGHAERGPTQSRPFGRILERLAEAST